MIRHPEPLFGNLAITAYRTFRCDVITAHLLSYLLGSTAIREGLQGDSLNSGQLLAPISIATFSERKRLIADHTQQGWA